MNDAVIAAAAHASRMLRALPNVSFSDHGATIGSVEGAGVGIWSLHELADAIENGDLPLRVYDAALQPTTKEPKE